MYYWDISYDREKEKMAPVSVVVRRMYYWDLMTVAAALIPSMFQ